MIFKKKSAKTALIALISLLCLVTLTACNRTEQYSVYGGIPLEIQVEGTGGKKLSDNIAEYISGLEPILSLTVSGSDLNKINQSEVGTPVVCRGATMEIMRVAENVYGLSGGAYDPSIFPLVKLWGFDSESFIPDFERNPPEKEQIEITKQLVGLDKTFDIDYENNTVTKKIAGAQLDFGGIAKGYAVDKAKNFIGNQKVLIYLGGNIAVKNKNYPIGIINPRVEQRNFGTLTLKSGSCISTSGDYERNFPYYKSEDEIIFYHHILNPFTGYPAGIDPDTGEPNADGAETVISATVITTNGALGDALSTAVMVLGKTAGSALINRLVSEGKVESAIIIDSNLKHTVLGNSDFKKK